MEAIRNSGVIKEALEAPPPTRLRMEQARRKFKKINRRYERMREAGQLKDAPRSR